MYRASARRTIGGMDAVELPSPFSRFGPDGLEAERRARPHGLLLDVRRSQAFRDQPEAIPGAIAVPLDEDPVLLPDVSKDTPIAVYCLCSGEASSSRVARWLLMSGYQEVAVLSGGLGAWKMAGYPLAPIDIEASRENLPWLRFSPEPVLHKHSAATLADPFRSRLEDTALWEASEKPIRRNMAVAFVDMANSTELIHQLPPEAVLEIVQDFMEIVVEVGTVHCGDVHDFEGDGALLYFEGVGESVPAAFEIRSRLLSRHRADDSFPQARISLDQGPLVIGPVGSRFRRGISLVGPSVPRASRILKLAPPGGIITTEDVVLQARSSSPDLAKQFQAIGPAPTLRGMEEARVQLYVAAAPPG